MPPFKLVGATYQSLSPSLDAQFTMNWYLEQDESGAGRSPMAMFPTPGLSLFTTLPSATEVLALLEFQGLLYGVGQTSGSTMQMWQIQQNGGFSGNTAPLASGAPGVASIIGTPATASISLGVPIITICSGGKLFNVELPSFTVVTQAQNQYRWAEYLDGFIVALCAGNQFQIFGPNDPTVYNALNLATASVVADNFVAMSTFNRLLVFFTEKQAVPYYNSGALFPFVPVSGVLIDAGCAATKSPVRADNSVFWIGADVRGGGIAYRANGYTPQRISTFAVETAWRQYSSIIDAFGYSYQDMGHTFVVWNFPTGNATWVYDVSNQMWHQRSYWNAGTGKFDRQRQQVHAYCFGKHYVGDYASGNIYAQNVANLDDNGNAIHRVRRAPYVAKEHEWLFHESCEVLCETGLPSTVTAPGPQIFLRWSDDGGHVWSNYYQTNLGLTGEYRTRAIWRRLGRSRNRVYEISCSDPYPLRLIDGYIQAS